MVSSPCGADSRLADAALRICVGNYVGCSKRKKSRSQHRRRINPIARLPLGFREMLSFVNRPQESGRPDGSEHAASLVVLLSRSPSPGSIHRLLSEDGADCDISSSDVFLQLFGASCIGSKARR